MTQHSDNKPLEGYDKDSERCDKKPLEGYDKDSEWCDKKPLEGYDKDSERGFRYNLLKKNEIT